MLARRYEIHVRGVLAEHVLADILADQPTLEVRTVLSGLVRDQAELQGLLRRMHNLGLELLELRQAPRGVGTGAAGYLGGPKRALMMIRVELVIAGGLGELVQSMFPELVAEKRQFTTVVVDDQVAAAELLAALGRAGIEVDRVTEIPMPVRAGQPPTAPSEAPDGSAVASAS